ncbi:MAG: glycosyl transferase [Caulobacteraceae bacterium]|nr:glycosyl transferase [Caulobacteraceae bacterium]
MSSDFRPIGASIVLTQLPSEPPEVSVVMVVYRTGPALFNAIPRVLAEPLVDEFVVVDNGSTPEDEATLRAIAEHEPRFRLVQGHGNIGFARGCNLGARTAKGHHLVILNPDAYLQQGCIASLIQAAKSFPSPCVVGARVLNSDGTEQRGGRRGEVTPVTTLLSFSHLSLSLRLFRKFEIHMEDQLLPDRPIAVPTISGACFYMSREDFQKLGGFDERYFLHVEDVDLCWRARRMGGSVVFQPAATVEHLGSTSLKHPVVVEYHKGRGLVRYFRKRADNPWRYMLAVGLSPLIMAVSVMRPALRSIFGQTRGKGK